MENVIRSVVSIVYIIANIRKIILNMPIQVTHISQVRGAYRTPLSQTNFRNIILYVGFSPVNVSDTAKKHYLCARQDRSLFYERA